MPTDLSSYKTRALENLEKLKQDKLTCEQWKDVSLLMLSEILDLEKSIEPNPTDAPFHQK
jgi:hypothetical protein